MIELLVVTTIIIILSTIGLVSYRVTAKNARDAKRRADLETVRQALVLYRSDNGEYIDSTIYTTATSSLNSAGYLSSPIPQDPKFPTQEYSYTSDGVTFTLTATLEDETSPAYVITSP